MHWYAMWVITSKEDELGVELSEGIQALDPVKDSSDRYVPREAEYWVPKKTARKWNPRCLSNKHDFLSILFATFHVKS
jgi:hypothetical protein